MQVPRQEKRRLAASQPVEKVCLGADFFDRLTAPHSGVAKIIRSADRSTAFQGAANIKPL